LYSTYEEECEAEPDERRKIMVLGGGPNRIGQGIEFDYCCVHAALALRDDGFETIMVNCNPETVSTDYDTSDRLYFEPLTLEDVLEVVHCEKPEGVIVQYGGQTPLNLARPLQAAGVPIIGTSPDSIDLAEDRERFQQLLHKLGLKQPPNRTASDVEQAVQLAAEIGYPLVVRPSYVLGGRAMDVVHSEQELRRYMSDAVSVSNDSPVLLDRFLDHAIEVDVDAICDGRQVLIGGIMEHIEQAGVHSGDSACCIPPHSLSEGIQDELRKQMTMLGLELGVIGLMNAQFAIRGEDIYILEVNPRASRTVPFVSKATGRPLASIAALCMAGKTLEEQDITDEIVPDFYSMKEAILPFIKFPGVDPILGPEMRSTGEVMGVGKSFGGACARAMKAAQFGIPKPGRAFLSVRDADKESLLPIAEDLLTRGYTLIATGGTCQYLRDHGFDCERVNKVLEGRPHIVDKIKNGEIAFIVNTTEGRQAIRDSYSIRREALQYKVSYTTTIARGWATLQAIDHEFDPEVRSLQQLHAAAHRRANTQERRT
ncbi:MAG: carbamoyl-phosphate synthase large subunit, partial [Lysobacterales bacterium]